MNVAVFIPHCDDGIMGCGATIAKYVRLGYNVDLVFFTDGIAHQPKKLDWREAIYQSSDYLGIPENRVYLLGLKNQRFDEYTLIDINKKVEALDLKPDLVISPTSNDSNYDHTVVFRCALVQVRPIARMISHLSMEIPSNSEWGGVPFKAEYYIPVSSDDLSRKMGAMKFFEAELRSFPHPRSLETIMLRAKLRGSEICQPLAEAFEVVKFIET